MIKPDLLKGSHLCAGLDPKELGAIAHIAVQRSLAKNELLFIEGDSATGFFTLINGRVRIYKASPEGKEHTIHIIRPGQMFAEVAIFHGGCFPANCSAIEKSEVAFFPRDSFLALLSSSPQISLKIIGSLSAFLREYNELVENLSLKEVSARLASFLLSEYERIPGEVIHLRYSKSQLASRIGTISETLSRNLRKLIDNGVIRVNNKEITVVDAEKLKAIAQGEKS
jgi:CRP/FNR family transcriptional regulator